MKVLWFSNSLLLERDPGSSGSWIRALANALTDSSEVILANLTQENVGEVTRADCGAIRQWVVPPVRVSRRGTLSTPAQISRIVQAVEEFSPDLIHVWGTEGSLGLLTARKHVRRPALLETQGLKSAIADVYYGGLSEWERFRCIGLKEILKRTTIAGDRKRYVEWGAYEKEIISGHAYVTVQNQWLESQIRSINKTSTVFFNEFALRSAFYTPNRWKYSGKPVFFTSSAYPLPFKGLHVAIRAISLLKNSLPSVRLRIGGALVQAGIRRDGYIAWVMRLARRLGVEENIEWLGALSPDQIVEELGSASGFIMPSFIEGYCLGLAEAMMVGVPSVTARVGGVPHLGKDDESLLFYSAGDASRCASQLTRVLTDRGLAERLSTHGRALAEPRNAQSAVVARQMEIYRRVAAESQGDHRC